MATKRNLQLKEWTWAMDHLGFVNKATKEFIGENEIDLRSAPTDAGLNLISRKKKEMYKPEKVRDLKCSLCGELLLRIFPWAMITVGNADKMVCKKCAYEQTKKNKR